MVEKKTIKQVKLKKGPQSLLDFLNLKYEFFKNYQLYDNEGHVVLLLSQKQFMNALNRSTTTISKYKKVLIDNGLLVKEKYGFNGNYYYLPFKEHADNVTALPEFIPNTVFLELIDVAWERHKEYLKRGVDFCGIREPPKDFLLDVKIFIYMIIDAVATTNPKKYEEVYNFFYKKKETIENLREWFDDSFQDAVANPQLDYLLDDSQIYGCISSYLLRYCDLNSDFEIPNFYQG